jgi:hypothetical protein
MRSLVFMLASFSMCLSASSYADSQKNVRMIDGAVGFWKRSCGTDGQCPPVPEAVGEIVAISGSVTEPASPVELGSWQSVITQGDLTLEFRVFWKSPLPPENPHLIFQHRLTHKDLGPVFECSQFKGIDQPPPFSVGVCAGFVKIGEEFQEFGVSFYKRKP